MKILFVNTQGSLAYKIVVDSVIAAFKRICEEDETIEFLETDHKKTERHHIAPFVPDWVLTVGPLTNHSYCIKRYRGWLSVGWDQEGMYDWNRLSNTDCPNFHIMASVDPAATRLLNEQGVPTIYLPTAHDKNTYKYEEVEEEYKSDAIIGGVMYPARVEIVKELVPILDKVKLRTINSVHWESKLIPYRKYITYYHRDMVVNEEYNKYCSGSKIILIGNRDFEPGNNHPLIHSEAIGRVFQETAIRRCVFVDNKRPNIKNHFEIGKEIVVFENGQDLRDKILYYLEHEEEREAIAHNGYIRTSREHQYYHRVKQLVEWIRINLDEFKRRFELN